MLIMEARGMTPRDPDQARHSLFGDLYEPGGGSDTTAFPQMVDDIFRYGFWKLGIE